MKWKKSKLFKTVNTHENTGELKSCPVTLVFNIRDFGGGSPFVIVCN